MMGVFRDALTCNSVPNKFH